MSTFNNILDSLCGKNKWIAYCISLDRCVDRQTNFKSWADKVGLDFNWWSATDKLDLVQADYDTYCDVYVNGTCKSAGATACRISHHKLTKHLLKNRSDYEYFFILEDDAGFNGDFSSKKEHLFNFINEIMFNKYKWNSLWFGHQINGGMKILESIPGAQYTQTYKQTHLNHAMLIEKNQVELHLQQLNNPKHKNLAVGWTIDNLRISKLGITLGPISNIIDQVDTVSYIWN